ncbi:hypothetical protein AB0B85_29240 [Micromonospora sp. NPDC049044]|uniref:hypothetical protein n=1 Tax=unclassified Micromonospora TaxID=2617518 RepID=UPI0033E5914A
MRRDVSSVTVALGLLGATVALAGVAAAAPAPGSSEPPAATAGQKRCTITDERLRELSGLVATKSGYIVVNDSTEVTARKRVFFLDTKCKISKDPVQYPGQGPVDTEDLALSKDGTTLWIADTGDNVDAKERRTRVALWSMPVTGGRQPTQHRISYPEGKPHDAEALLMGDDGKPLIITKVTSGKAEIYTPTAALRNGDAEAVPMRKAGEITLPKTQTENPLNTFGRIAITGAARSPDGSRVVLRTYADAFEYDVSGGDIVGALTTNKPRVTALADPFGEAISYSADGKSFLTVSDAFRFSDDEPLDILSYSPSTSTAVPVAAGAEGAKPAASTSWTAGLDFDDITYLVGAVGLIGLLLVAAGIFGIVRARRRLPAADAAGTSDPGGESFNPGAGRAVDGSPALGDRKGGVYGGGPPAGAYSGGPGRGGPTPAGGAVYGGGRPAATDGGYGAARPDGGAAGVYGGARPPAGGARPPAAGGRPPVGGGARPPAGGGRPQGGARPPVGGGRPQGAGGGGGRPQGAGGVPPVAGGRPGSGVYGGDGGPPGTGRAEPPRRGGQEPDPRGQRPGRRRDDDAPVDPYGQYPGGGRGHRGDRY